MDRALLFMSLSHLIHLISDYKNASAPPRVKISKKKWNYRMCRFNVYFYDRCIKNIGIFFKKVASELSYTYRKGTSLAKSIAENRRRRKKINKSIKVYIEKLNKSLDSRFKEVFGKIVKLHLNKKIPAITKIYLRDKYGFKTKFKLETETGLFVSKKIILNPRGDCVAPRWFPEWHPATKKALSKQLSRKIKMAKRKSKKLNYDEDLE
jgi:hypothetical protein